MTGRSLRVTTPGSATTTYGLVAAALWKLGHRLQAALVLVAIIGWPIAHIGNIAAAAIPVDIILVVAFGSLLRSVHREQSGPEFTR